MAASFPVSAAKAQELMARLARMGVCETELRETFFRCGGVRRGVELEHLRSGIRVRCHREKSQGLNRFFARRMLVEELEARQRHLTRHEAKAVNLRERKHRRSPKKGARSVHEIVVGQFHLRAIPRPEDRG